jgi:hypothetical protein
MAVLVAPDESGPWGPGRSRAVAWPAWRPSERPGEYRQDVLDELRAGQVDYSGHGQAPSSSARSTGIFTWLVPRWPPAP